MAESEDEVIQSIYGNGAMRVEDADDVKDSCILTPLNDASLEINHKVCFQMTLSPITNCRLLKHSASVQVLEMLPGETIVCRSVDRCNKESKFMELPTEIYNKVTPMGLPPHELRLKKVCSIRKCNSGRLKHVFN